MQCVVSTSQSRAGSGHRRLEPNLGQVSVQLMQVYIPCHLCHSWLPRVRTYGLSSEKQQWYCDWVTACAFRTQQFFPQEPQRSALDRSACRWPPLGLGVQVPAGTLPAAFQPAGGDQVVHLHSVDFQGMNFMWRDSRKLRWPTPCTSVNLPWTCLNPTWLTWSGGKEWGNEVLSDSRHRDPELCGFEGPSRLQSHRREHPEKRQSQELSGQWQRQAGHPNTVIGQSLNISCSLFFRTSSLICPFIGRPGLEEQGNLMPHCVDVHVASMCNHFRGWHCPVWGWIELPSQTQFVLSCWEMSCEVLLSDMKAWHGGSGASCQSSGLVTGQLWERPGGSRCHFPRMHWYLVSIWCSSSRTWGGIRAAWLQTPTLARTSHRTGHPLCGGTLRTSYSVAVNETSTFKNITIFIIGTCSISMTTFLKNLTYLCKQNLSDRTFFKKWGQAHSSVKSVYFPFCKWWLYLLLIYFLIVLYLNTFWKSYLLGLKSTSFFLRLWLCFVVIITMTALTTI